MYLIFKKLSNLTKNDSNCRDIVSFTQIQMDDRERLTLVTWWSSDIIPTVKYNFVLPLTHQSAVSTKIRLRNKF